MTTPATTTVRKHRTAGGIDIFSISINVFDDFWGNVYVLDHPEALVLVDTGSGLAKSNQGIEQGLQEIATHHGRHFDVQDFEIILITHGHIDHFGGLPFLAEASKAEIWVHPDDSKILTDYTSRLQSTIRKLERFLLGAGVRSEDRESLLEVYRWGKDHYRSQPAEPCLTEGLLDPFGFRIRHVPGHCPGHICIQADDILLTGDHVLARISPHLAPEAITANTGMRTYLASLRRIAQLKGIRVALGGHESPIFDLAARCREIEQLHWRRLRQVEQLCHRPCSIREMSRSLFGELRSYHVLLGLEEAGALAEFLVRERRLLVEAGSDGTRTYSQCSQRG